MLPTVHVELLAVLIWIFVSYSQSTGCGHLSRRKIAEGVWPWMVAITKKEKSGSYGPSLWKLWCNGFLIDRRHVLTAAHCFTSKSDVKDILARIGKVNMNKGEEYEITCITIHPRYKSEFYYDDIAILTLSRDVDTPDYTPICLPDDNLRKKSLYGLEVTKTAWGAVTAGGIINNTLIQNTGLRIISNRDCNKEFSKMSSFRRQFPGSISSDMFCTENPTGQMESCEGSSGAPLMYRDNRKKWIAVGISTFGNSCGLESLSGNTRVSAYVEWIIENTGDDKGNCS